MPLIILNITCQADAQLGADDSDDMDIGTPQSPQSEHFVRHLITVPTPQCVDGQVRLVERGFDFSYKKDPVMWFYLTL
jgi:hypothetical protein